MFLTPAKRRRHDARHKAKLLTATQFNQERTTTTRQGSKRTAKQTAPPERKKVKIEIEFPTVLSSNDASFPSSRTVHSYSTAPKTTQVATHQFSRSTVRLTALYLLLCFPSGEEQTRKHAHRVSLLALDSAKNNSSPATPLKAKHAATFVEGANSKIHSFVIACDQFVYQFLCVNHTHVYSTSVKTHRKDLKRKRMIPCPGQTGSSPLR